MLRLDRYIAGSVLSAVALVWTVLLALDLVTAFAKEIDEIGSGSYSIGGAIAYVAFTIPRRAYDLFGTSAVIGGLLGLGALAPTAELTAMRAAGMSKLRICTAAAAGIAFATVLVVTIGETLGPWGEQRAQSIAAGAKSSDQISSGDTGLWAREGESLINAKRGRATIRGLELYDVRIYQFTEQGQLQRITQAARATHEAGRWQLFEATRMRFENERIATESVPRLEWRSRLDPRVLALSVLRPRYLSAADLRTNIAYLERNRLDATPFESAYWARIFYPITLLALLFCALPFAFGTLRSGGLSKRLFVGIVLAIAWFLVQRAVVNLADVYAIDFRVAHGLPAVLLVLFAIAYFRRSA
ncbi:MAG TPA: LPS export ABC transporter permease LptG [Candidatus Saccharimonadia bacterium]|nr:LPS export ABC transporter permease LptG [Candidatus Saccharimonadia bacterium]